MARPTIVEQNVIVSESLPFKFGNYCDTFIGFHRDFGTELTFCSCQRQAVERHIQMSCLYDEAVKRKENLPWFVSYGFDYPRALWNEASLIFDTVPIHALPRFMRFADGLCHRCNRRMPYGYYGLSGPASGFFISHFRPYVNQACYAVGVTPEGHIVLPDVCPEPIKSLEPQARQDAIEAEVRRAFGFPPKGINRNQESKLALIVGEIFSDCDTKRHHRATWLQGLELDVFVEEHDLAIKFQGKQHSEAFDHLGGEVALQNTRRRDRKKAKLCKEQGVSLVFFEEGDDLSENLVRTRLRRAVPSLALPSRQQIERPPYCFFIPACGGQLRLTYQDDRNELHVSGRIGGAEVYASGTRFELSVSCEAALVVAVRFSIWTKNGVFKVTFPISAEEPQRISFGNGIHRPMLDFFKAWSMFNPRVALRENRAEPEAANGLRPAPLSSTPSA